AIDSCTWSSTRSQASSAAADIIWWAMSGLLGRSATPGGERGEGYSPRPPGLPQENCPCTGGRRRLYGRPTAKLLRDGGRAADRSARTRRRLPCTLPVPRSVSG